MYSQDFFEKIFGTMYHAERSLGKAAEYVAELAKWVDIAANMALPPNKI